MLVGFVTIHPEDALHITHMSQFDSAHTVDIQHTSQVTYVSPSSQTIMKGMSTYISSEACCPSLKPAMM